MIKRELKINLKSFIIWSSILIGIFLLVFLMYPSIVNGENAKALDEMIQMFPQELLIAFNMDISSMDSAFGWLKTEGFVFVLLIIGIYSGVMGSSILLKEESDKTIEYLNSLPIKRSKIVFTKMISGLIYILAMILLITIFNYCGLLLSGDFNHKQYWLLSITPIFSSLVIYFGCLFISTFAKKTRKMFGISLSIVMISYLLQMLSSLSETTEFLKYFSVFTLADIRSVIVNETIKPIMIIISCTLTIIFVVLSYISYNKKELV